MAFSHVSLHRHQGQGSDDESIIAVLFQLNNSNVKRPTRQVIREQVAECTVIAFVRAAVADFDRVAVIGGGRLLTWDSSRVLLALDSRSERLWDIQLR
ncbi:hypothetical protein J7T55_008655 [Diaporthe amygdali]|uniref:uncharacterized protein n=1 Tax=Phomopsis amygdali TaxID=1214568 RepID=UPI0022FE3707|nr:uncharacterized protein J7T55_008655 [Diaporthe amygdali]KAJ0121491.1 hypothetical protein J7T55_008655 [Diaporthe amygdali]